MDRKVNGRNIAVSLVMLTALLVTVSGAPAKSLPSQAARQAKSLPSQAARQGKSLPSQAAWQANAHQLGNRVLKAIHRVEKSELNCQTRNLLVHRLRLLHDAITSGRGTAARGFLIAWLHNVRTMQGAQLLTAEEGSALQVALMDMLEQVGEGWPKNPMPTRNWPKLPACEAASDEAVAVVSASDISDADVAVSGLAEGIYEGPVFTLSDTQYILKALVDKIPVAGMVLGPLVQILWPNGPDVTELIDEAIDDAVREIAINNLNQMSDSLNRFLDMEINNPSQASDAFFEAWDSINTGLVTFRWDHTDIRGKDYRVDFLPLFAQGENLHLALLREGILHGAEWGWTPENIEYWKGIMKHQLDPDYVNPDTDQKDQAMAWAIDIYNLGLSKKPTGMDQSSWTTRNKYVREYTLGVLDFVEIWKYMDPVDYPNGVSNLKLTRMIYSDPVGVTADTFTLPPYAYGPLRNLTVWADTNGDPNPFIDSMQQTGGPTAGPFTIGPVMGDTSHDSSPTRYDYDILPGNTLGPIVSVDGYSAMDWVKLLGEPEVLYGLSFTFASGGSSGLLGSHPQQYMHDNVLYTESEYHFSYPGEVVASVQAMGNYKFYNYQHGADSVVFGFRYADSYYPSGYLINSSTKDCMKPSLDGHVTLGICLENIWTYNLAFRQLSTLGRCLDTNDDGKAILNDCKDVPTQRWDIIPSGVGGTIGRGGQVLTPSPLYLYLADDDGFDNQRWITPNHVQGPVHSVAAGYCLGGQSSPAPGTYMKIDACASGYKPGQTWTYSPSMGTLSLEAGTMCLDAPDYPEAGDQVQVNPCDDRNDSQQWILEPDTSRIQHVNSGLYLDLLGGYTKITTPVVLGDGNDTYSQKWTWPMY